MIQSVKMVKIDDSEQYASYSFIDLLDRCASGDNFGILQRTMTAMLIANDWKEAFIR